MTIEEVKKTVEEIEACKSDYEVAHSKEDALWESVLTEVAKSTSEFSLLAAEALKTRDIDFERYCA